jgi:hypothetical protein
MQTALDQYLDGYNNRRPNQGRGMNGRTPARAFIDGLTKSKTNKGGDRSKNQPLLSGR